ncbi:rhodanese-like domain-containing protein [Aerococcaceae bacterium zg-ZJ1578]|uniref:rhodanese-like domain-containing protein n=1 Tax=Aerococcaceae bacterium zg-252 TaxID=2796928 RepID=UPI001A1D5779|nr:rhodanese-like domain-containing protein [Aerococcaceae bacterium zg-1578]MBR7928383.1 rhodanese-like domain-containing protein [Aerococcaceae bacterium zg-ZUI334]
MQSISMQAFAEKVANEALLILDVRDESKYHAGHIPGAKHFKAGETEKVLSKDDVYYIVCQMGVTSLRIATELDALGFNVVNVEGGMSQWQGEVTAS